MKKNKIKIFADGADYKSIIDFNKKSFVKGLTTNPSLMKKSGVSDYCNFAKKVLKNVKDKKYRFARVGMCHQAFRAVRPYQRFSCFCKLSCD